MSQAGTFVPKFSPNSRRHHQLVRSLIGADIARLVRPETRVVFLESPGSITMEVHDVPAIVAAVRQVAPEAIIMIDNTWAAGILFKALDFGIDISIQAGTKYLIGHSDAMVGTAVANARCWPQLRENAYLMGQMLDADTAYMTSRGLRTLGVRLRQHHESSLRIAEWLAQHPQVARVKPPRPCPAVKVMSSGNVISPAAAGYSRLCSASASMMPNWRSISTISACSVWLLFVGRL